MGDKRGLVTLVAVAIASLAAIASVSILANAFVRVRTQDEMIRVVGSARKSLRSDFIIWDGGITENAKDVATAYAALQKDAAKVKAYLVRKGIKPEEILPAAISTKTIYAKVKTPPNARQTEDPESEAESDSETAATYRPIVGYQLSQTIEVRSSQVDKVDAISRESTELINEGMSFESQAPMYLYTKLSDLKVTMQAEAAKDARARAEQIAQSSGSHLGPVRFARMQVPNITPLYSNEGDGGVDDTTSLDKKITAIVVAGYAIR